MSKKDGVERRNDKVPDSEIQGNKAGERARAGDLPREGEGASAGQPAAAPTKPAGQRKL
jgi:hypothetical protein